MTKSTKLHPSNASPKTSEADEALHDRSAVTNPRKTDPLPLISKLYLIPHSHTDIGYTHDPVVTWELHDRFMDRALHLCEVGDDDAPESFCWLNEVFATFEHWWHHREAKDHRRAVDLIRRGRLEVGARRYNGTFLQDPLDQKWEVDQLAAFARRYDVGFSTAVQNDVNGFPVALMDRLSESGCDQLMMGLNTTMGVSPGDRPRAFWWRMPSGRRVLVWHGLIYNFLRPFLHLDRLAEELPTRWEQITKAIPDDYPFDFLVLSGTMMDNVGPFERLPSQVARLNESADAEHALPRIEITTPDRLLSRIRKDYGDQLPEHAGEWPDAWAFGQASFPQALAALRRAQRRLTLVQGIRDCGWAHVNSGTLDVEKARQAIAMAAEHTYCSHSSSAAGHDSPDAQRQWAQAQEPFWRAESCAMASLRDHLAACSEGLNDVSGTAALVANPGLTERCLRLATQQGAVTSFAQPGKPEHLYQFDREPTTEAIAASPDRFADANVGRITLDVIPLEHASGNGRELPVRSPDLSWQIDQQRGGLEALTDSDGYNWVDTTSKLPFASLVLESLPQGASFQAKPAEGHRDPSDMAWDEDLVLNRKPQGSPREVTESGGGQRLAFDHPEVDHVSFSSCQADPAALQIRVGLRLADRTDFRAIYLTLPLSLGESGETDYWVDSGGTWICAGREGHQLEGSVTSHYEAGLGVAAQRGDRAVLVAARDTALWQLGGLTFGPPTPALDRQRPCLTAWLYNNYWFCNFPAASPGYVELQFLVKPLVERKAVTREQLLELSKVFTDEYRTHPIA